VTEYADPYVYPGTKTLCNSRGITDRKILDRVERRLVTQRIKDGVPGGRFDLAHLQAIHRHLFQDIYDWTGELRTVEISKGGHQFQFSQYIRTGMADVHRRLVQSIFLLRLSWHDLRNRFIIGDVNYIHPFREGNGRTQAQYLKQLAAQASHDLDLTLLDPVDWMNASKASHAADYSLMAEVIERAITGPHAK
jgi:cell filamentation protein